MNVLIVIITVIMLSSGDEFACLVIAVLQGPFLNAKNTIRDKNAD